MAVNFIILRLENIIVAYMFLTHNLLVNVSNNLQDVIINKNIKIIFPNTL